ncbi:hypothetical protein PVK06_019656 [Gossypium arboreum]|uniref:Uncharacterized protein n=1 Tax=Gossypium arboreum TaxID=29729 RepID=A0ABR0PKC0_GOSAR|nr:hypothetical protein PVK06_019656 [Gossypium arboreum]
MQSETMIFPRFLRARSTGWSYDLALWAHARFSRVGSIALPCKLVCLVVYSWSSRGSEAVDFPQSYKSSKKRKGNFFFKRISFRTLNPPFLGFSAIKTKLKSRGSKDSTSIGIDWGSQNTSSGIDKLSRELDEIMDIDSLVSGARKKRKTTTRAVQSGSINE